MASLPVWNYDKPPISPLIGKVGDLANNLYSSNIPGAKMGVSRFFSLYLFILQHRDLPSETLRQRILINGKPVFTPAEMENVLAQIKSQQGTSFAQRLLRTAQKGGAGPAGAAPNGKNGEAAKDDNPSRSKFWDKFIRDLLYKVARYIPPSFDRLTPFIFALYGLEQIEIVGPLIATFLDSITLGLPTLGKLMGDSVSRLVLLAPVPYAGVVGNLASYFIGLLFIMISAVMSVSRKQFGTAFTVGIGAAPLIGDQLSDAALMFEKQVERYDYNKKKILASIEGISPHTADVVDYWTPSKEEIIKLGPPVIFDPNEALLDLLEKAVDDYGPETTMAIIDDPSILPPGADKVLGAAATAASPPPLGNATPAANKPAAAIGGANKIRGRRKTRKHRK
jgi:hypothetical protein